MYESLFLKEMRAISLLIIQGNRPLYLGSVQDWLTYLSLIEQTFCKAPPPPPPQKKGKGRLWTTLSLQSNCKRVFLH